jgi:hypothetical protein
VAEGIQIKNLPSTTAVKQGDTMTIVQDKQNKQLSLDVFANESDLATLSPLENRCDEVKAKIEVDEYSAEITTSQSMSEIGSDDNGANLHENVLDGAFESCVLKGKTKYRDIDTGEILEDFEEGRNLELITVRMPILTTTGKNLLDIRKAERRNSTKCSLINNGDGSITLVGDGDGSGEGILTTSCYTYLEEGKTYTFSFESDGQYSGTNGTDTVEAFLLKNGSASEYIHRMTDFITTFTCGRTGDYYVRFDINKNNTTHKFWNIQLTEGATIYPYEPYKSSILSFNQKDDKTIVLRSLPDGTCDTLNVETGEYVQRIGERSYQNGDTNSNNLVTDGTKTQYKLSSPIITKVDVQGFPHAYKNGHIQLSSDSIEPSLTPTVTYKVPVSRVGQIASNTKSNLRQTIKLDQLEILAYQSLINAEYENLLVQNSAESAASFTNLSTNDPKDELYYMLKHLIEEDQPVQNMLDKINLFYLYGLLNDEHYFDLLLGGEEDVY